MSRCIDSKIGALLYGYEIGILSEEEAGQFEEHLLECEHCYNELKNFEREASLLSNDAEIRALAGEASRGEVESRPLISSILRNLWPNVPLVFRPALSYGVVAVLLAFAFYGFRGPGSVKIREFEQVIRLSSARTFAAVLSKSQSQEALLMFRCDGCTFGGTYRVVVESEDGNVIYCNYEFASFDERHIGCLNLAIRDMDPGLYRLIVSSLPSDPASVSEEYPFRVEE